MKPMPLLRALLARRSLVAGVLACVAAWFLMPVVAPEAASRWSMRFVVAWDAGALVMVVGMLWLMWRAQNVGDIKARAARLDQGSNFTLLFAVAAAGMSLVAIAAELIQAKSQSMTVGAAGLAVATTILSWIFTHLIFALHYAHDYWNATPGGLMFPAEKGGDSAPDYWDFAHFSLIIGVANQTADVQITTKRLRRLATFHSLVAFVFNTVVLALTINLAASLAGG